MNHKKKKQKNARAHCHMCKFYKDNGYRTERLDGEKFSDHRRRLYADVELRSSTPYDKDLF